MKIPLEVKTEGLYCPAGDFFIDAWKSVPVCIITHAHSDHARSGHGLYISTDYSEELLKYRLGSECKIVSYPYRKKFKMKNCWVSLHPAGHILGSAQIRIEIGNQVCVISGDYKRGVDPTCEPFELQECDTFVTESTFALPIYRWEPGEVTVKRIYEWWQENRSRGFCSVVYCYALGKAQRIMSLLSTLTTEPIYLHGGILPLAEIYKSKNVPLGQFLPVHERTFAGQLILAPPLAKGTPWNRKFYPYRTAYASGWMQVRGIRKQKNVDRGFILSDHADWPDLLKTIQETKASTIFTTHGNAGTLAHYLQDQKINAYPLHGTEILEEGEG